MKFDSTAYGPMVAAILALDGNGDRLMPLASGRCSSTEALTRIEAATPSSLFPNSRAPQAALSGLYLYFSCRDRSHEVAQSLDSSDGAYWHGIVHRQEPDPGNARYWFRRVGSHPIFHDLALAARQIAERFPAAHVSLDLQWDPIRFVDICEQALQKSGSPLARMALELQRAEWQLLFNYCASNERAAS